MQRARAVKFPLTRKSFLVMLLNRCCWLPFFTMKTRNRRLITRKIVAGLSEFGMYIRCGRVRANEFCDEAFCVNLSSVIHQRKIKMRVSHLPPSILQVLFTTIRPLGLMFKPLKVVVVECGGIIMSHRVPAHITSIYVDIPLSRTPNSDNATAAELNFHKRA